MQLSVYSPSVDSSTVENEYDETANHENTDDKYNFQINGPSETEEDIYDFNNFGSQVDDENVIKSFELYDKIGRYTPNQVFDETAASLNKYIKVEDPEYMSLYKINAHLIKQYPVRPVARDTCRRGCMIFQENEVISKCKYCHLDRLKSNGKPFQTMVMLPLRQQLAILMSEKSTRENMLYRANYTDSPRSDNDMDGVSDSQVYKYLSNKKGLFQNKYDIALGFFMDGFQVFENGSHSMTIRHLLNLNFDPIIRKELKNMFQVRIIPGKKQPKDYRSFLRPIWSELKEIQKNSVKVKIETGEIIEFKAHFLHGTGDIPAACSGTIGRNEWTHYHLCMWNV